MESVLLRNNLKTEIRIVTILTDRLTEGEPGLAVDVRLGPDVLLFSSSLTTLWRGELVTLLGWNKSLTEKIISDFIYFLSRRACPCRMANFLMFCPV